METIKLTLEIPAELATALTELLQGLKVVAKKENSLPVVGGGSVPEGQGCPLPLTVDEVEEFCIENNLVVSPSKFFKYYNDRDWKNSKGVPVSNWKDLIKLWDEDDRRKNPQLKPARRHESYDDTERVARMMGLK